MLTQMCLLVHGGIVCDHTYLRQEGRGMGSMVVHKALGGSTRWIWISNELKTEHKDAYALFSAEIAKRGGPLKEVSRNEFADKVMQNEARPRRQQRTMQTIALVTERQKGTDPFKNLPYVLTWSGLFNQCGNIDANSSAFYGRV